MPLKSRSATIDLPSSLRRILRGRKLEATVAGDDDYIFVTRNGTPYSQRNVNRMFNRTMIAAGINAPDAPPHERRTFQSLRKTFTSAVIEESKGVQDIERLSKQLRHGSMSLTLDVYAKQFASASAGGETGRAVDRVIGTVIRR